MPPAASSNVAGLSRARRSATSGTRVIVERSAPWPPASVPWATSTDAPQARAMRACAIVCTWQISFAPAARIRGAKGVGSPKESSNAQGACARATSSTSGRLAIIQVMKPQPTRALPAAAYSRSIQAASPGPAPSMPNPPASLTAAASFPPAVSPIGAERIGARIPNISVSLVRIAKPTLLAIATLGASASSASAVAAPRLRRLPHRPPEQVADGVVYRHAGRREGVGVGMGGGVVERLLQRRGQQAPLQLIAGTGQVDAVLAGQLVGPPFGHRAGPAGDAVPVPVEAPGVAGDAPQHGRELGRGG